MSKVDSYEMKFDFKLDDLKYECTEVLRGEFSENLELDSENLLVRYVKADGKDAPFKTENRKLRINNPPGKEIEIHFSGTVSEISLMGIHDAKYESGHIITTQMEPTGARSVFPCVDEPSAKAKFKVEVTVDRDVEVIFNTRPQTREVGPGKAYFSFEETPPMSTYLFYLGIGRFETISRKKGDRTLYLSTSPGKAREGSFSLGLLARLFKRYEDYYKIEFPLPKMHLVALPQFGAGAMENWGAITFRETALLVNKSTSFASKKQVGYVVSHEFAHQWFGDLVTMRWWDDLWLNESFATFVGYKILEKVKKDWNLWEDFLREETLSSMKKDGLLSTHPIRVEVRDPDEISEIFDDISYGKGASILRMTEQFIGESRFRAGVYNYLKGHEYSNASGEDLWTSLSNASGKDVSSLMKSWLEKAGFPLVRVRESEGGLVIRQERFTYLPNDDPYLWQVPIFIEVNGKRRKFLLTRRESRLRNSSGAIVNPRGEGYYRLLFEGGLLDRAISENSTPEFLMKLIDDYYSFLLSGQIALPEFISLINRLRGRNEYSVVLRIIGILEELTTILDSGELESMMVSYLKEKLDAFTSFHDENSKVVLERVLTGLARHDKEFREREKLKIVEYSNVMAEERMAVLISAAKEEFRKEDLWSMARKPENDMEAGRILSAMVHLPNNSEITEFLDFVKSKPEYRANSIYSIFSAIAVKHYRRDLWKWMSENIGPLREVFVGSSTISRLLEEMIAYSGIGNRQLVDEFVGREKIPEAARAIKNGLEKLEINERLIKRTS